METILQSALTTIGIKVAGELTWNIIKTSSNKIIESFKKKFVNNYEINEDECVEFLEDIATNKSNNPKRPFKEVMSFFEKYIDNDCPEEFVNDFKDWLIGNKIEFESIKNNIQQQKSSIVINGNQYADRGGSVQIIGNQYNNM